MPRGGYRPGGGRKPGSANKLTRDTLAAVEATGEADLFAALGLVAEDSAVPMEVRFEATRRLFGMLAHRIYTSVPPDGEDGHATEAAALEKQGTSAPTGTEKDYEQ